MNETRYDWLTDRWVIFAPNREERPDQFKLNTRAVPSGGIECPFCVGFEHETPHPTLVLPEYDSDATTSNRKSANDPARNLWKVRVVPNKFPAVPRTCLPDSLEHDLEDPGIFSERVQNRKRSAGQADLSPQASTATLNNSRIFQRRQPRGGHEVIIESPHHVGSITTLAVEHIAVVFEAYRRRLLYWRA